MMDWYEFVAFATETAILALTFWWVTQLQDEVNKLKEQIKGLSEDKESN